MQDEALISENITIIGRTYPVKLSRKEAELLSEIEADLNQSILGYQQSYPGKDRLDYVIMTLLTYVFDEKSTSMTSGEVDAVKDKIATIQSLLKV